MDYQALFIRSDAAFSQLVDAVEANQWALPTPDTEWTVRDLLNHVVGEELWLPDMLAGKTIAEVGTKYDGDVLGDNPQTAWHQATAKAQVAIAGLKDVESIVHLSFGDTPAREYLVQMLIDRVIHGWDLATAIGADTTIDPELAQPVYEALVEQAEAWRAGGVFGPKVDVPDSADLQTKLLALSGRKV